jgi:Leucine-rich repeat (LRR) protein
VTLSECKNADLDLTPLRDVPDVSFQNLKVSDVSGLGGKRQKSIVFHHCANILSVNHLTELKTLAVHGCPLVADVSALRRVKELEFISCPLLQDFSQLNIATVLLTIDSCHPVPILPERSDENYPPLTSLTLGDCEFSSLPPAISSYQRLAVLKVSRCPRLTAIELDVTAPHQLPYLTALTISNCSALESISPQIVLRVRHYKLEDLPVLVNLSTGRWSEQSVDEESLARSRRQLWMRNCPRLLDFDSLRSFSPVLKIQLSPQLESFAPGTALDRLRVLELVDCDALTSCEGLRGEIDVLGICFCPRLTSLEGLQACTIKYLTVSSCHGLVDPSALQQLVLEGKPPRQVTIERCSRLTDVSGLNGLPDLRLLQCDGVEDIRALSRCHRVEF